MGLPSLVGLHTHLSRARDGNGSGNVSANEAFTGSGDTETWKCAGLAAGLHLSLEKSLQNESDGFGRFLPCQKGALQQGDLRRVAQLDLESQG